MMVIVCILHHAQEVLIGNITDADLKEIGVKQMKYRALSLRATWRQRQ